MVYTSRLKICAKPYWAETPIKPLQWCGLKCEGNFGRRQSCFNCAMLWTLAYGSAKHQWKDQTDSLHYSTWQSTSQFIISYFLRSWNSASRRFLSLQLTALAAASETGKHHGMPVPTALPKPRCQCLTSLSEPARKLAFEACSWRLWRPLPKRVNTMACRSQRRFRSPGATA